MKDSIRVITRFTGALLSVIGLFAALGAPTVFELVSGRQLPLATSGSENAMLAWSGVAFVRVFGAMLMSLGAVLYVANGDAPRASSIYRALLVGFLFTAVIATAQQISIWANGSGWTLVALFLVSAAMVGTRLYVEAPKSDWITTH